MPTIAELNSFHITQKGKFSASFAPNQTFGASRGIGWRTSKRSPHGGWRPSPAGCSSLRRTVLRRSAIAIDCDPAKADGLADHHGPKVTTGGLGPFRLSPFPFQLWCVDAGKPDPFSLSCLSGIAVVTAANGDGFQGRNRLRQAKHQQQG